MARSTLLSLIAVPVVASVLWSGLQAMSLRNAVEANTAPSAARSTAPAAAPTAVATVNVLKILGNLAQNGAWSIQLNNLVSSINTEGASRQERLKAMKEAAEKLTDPTERQQALDQFALEQLRSEEWLKLKNNEVDRERSLMLQSIIRAVRDEAKNVADSEGYQIVLVDDSGMKIQADTRVNASSESQVFQQIASLRLLYAAEVVDITEKVLVRIQNKSK